MNPPFTLSEIADGLDVLVWCLLPLVLFGRPPHVLFAWFVLSHLDSANPEIAAHTRIGVANAIRAIGVPLVILWRLRRQPSRGSTYLPVLLLIGLSGTAFVATLWTNYPLSGIKMGGHLLATVLGLAAIERLARAGAITVSSVTSFLLATLLLGFLQTVPLGGIFQSLTSPGQLPRLTSFVTPQQYAALLAALLAFVLWHPQLQMRRRLVLLALLWGALYWNGSRTWVIGALLIHAIHLLFTRRRTLGTPFIFSGAAAGTALLVVLLGSGLGDLSLDRSSRLQATIDSILRPSDAANDVGLGTIRFRQTLYTGTLDAIANSSVTELWFGHGTSSGGNIVTQLFPASYRASNLDPNRVLHNEWLRTAYEWGLFGFCLFFATLMSALAGAARAFYSSAGDPFAGMLLSYLPAYILAFSTENVLASSGNALVVGLFLIYGCFTLGRQFHRRLPLAGRAAPPASPYALARS